jgi:hypothetical protein
MRMLSLFGVSVFIAACGAGASDEESTGSNAESAPVKSSGESATLGGQVHEPPLPIPLPPFEPFRSCDAGVGGEDGGGFLSCASDADCIAVPEEVDCCYEGGEIAVNRDDLCAYLAATRCTDHRRLCPLFVRRDDDVAACNAATHMCEMVPPPKPDAGVRRGRPIPVPLDP